MSGDLRERIATAVRDAKRPVTFKGLRTRVKADATAQQEPFRLALEEAVAGGEVHRWPDHNRSQYFWHVAWEQKAREAVLESAKAAPSRSALIQLAGKGKRLPGFSPKRLESVVKDLIAGKQLLAVPALSKSKLWMPAGSPEGYLEKFRAAGCDLGAFFVGRSSRHSAGVDAAALVLETVRMLEPVRGVPVSTLRLRNQLRSLTKPEFDAAALELRRTQEVFLNQHADPYNISEEEKDLLIDGQDGTYYVAIAIR